jgi:hypothetical protein
LADPASARTFLTLRREQRPNEGGLRCEVAELDVGEKTDGEQTDRDLDACRAAAGTSAELTFVAAVLRLARADRSQRPRDVRDVLDAVNRLGAQPMSWSFAGLRAVGKTPKGVHLRPFDVLLRTIDGVAPERRSAEVASMLNKLQ